MLPDEIVVFANGTTESAFLASPSISSAASTCPTCATLADLSNKIKIRVNEGAMNCAMARNGGAKFCNGNIIIFFDADDLASKYKIEFTDYVLTKHDPDVFLHGYIRNQKKEVFAATKKRNFEDVRICQPPKINPDKLFTGVPPHSDWIWHTCKIHVTHGHATVKRTILDEIQYNESSTFRRGQDTKFCEDLSVAGKKIICTDYILTNYL